MDKFIRLPHRPSKRVSITISHHVYEMLQNQSDEQGRSFSNFCAFLLEEAIASMERSHATDPSCNDSIPRG